MTFSTRIDLKVHYTEKEEAKALGARWDAENQTWYAPPNTDLEHLKRWLPDGVLDKSEEPPKPPQEPQKGIALSELLSHVKGVVDQGLPDAIWVRAATQSAEGCLEPDATPAGRHRDHFLLSLPLPI
jgi:exodeoxyribonuclease VII large subunit